MRKTITIACFIITFQLFAIQSTNPEKLGFSLAQALAGDTDKSSFEKSTPTYKENQSIEETTEKLIIKVIKENNPNKKIFHFKLPVSTQGWALVTKVISDLSMRNMDETAQWFSALFDPNDKNKGDSSRTAYWGEAMVKIEFLPESMILIYIERLKPPPSKAKQTKDLTLELRKKIFYETGETENRATKEAKTKYPYSGTINKEESGNRSEMMMNLMKKYRKEIWEKYNISEDQWAEINVEGIENHWPMAPSESPW